MMTFMKNHLTVFVVVLSMVSAIYGAECNCHCRGLRGQHICESFENLWRVANTNTEKLLEWERYRPFVERFSERWRKEIADIVQMSIEEYMVKEKNYPKPENLVSKLEDGIQNDASMISKPPEDGDDIVSNLLVKVEMVENRTAEVEEELKSERRVRRDLEKEVNEVQTVIYSSLEDMNKTIYEEHLKKLYYKVDGVVYKNETKKLDERLENIEIELHSVDNSSNVTKLAEDLKTLEENLQLLNDSIEGTLVPRIETMNNSIGDVLIPRIQTLEFETVRKNVTEELEDKMTSLLNNTELFKTSLVDVWSEIQDIRGFEEKFQNFSKHWSASLNELQSQVESLKNESLINRITESQDGTNNEIPQKDLKDLLQDNGPGNYEEDTTQNPEVTPNVVHRQEVSGEGTSEKGEDKDSQPIIIVDKLNILENSTNYEVYSTGEPEDAKRTYRELNDDIELCGKPVVKDPNLLVDIVTDSNGKKHLKFGCRPIGLYVVSYHPVPPRCENGLWKEPFPWCMKLPNITTEISSRDFGVKYRCPHGSVEAPDPTNCSQFFKCSHGRVSIISCPTGLHFNTRLKVCDYPRTAACVLDKSTYDVKLQTLIPPILIEPDNVDKPGSHLGTGTAGQLIVNPRYSFTLHCLYPENVWGYPKWNVTYTYSETSPRNVISREGNNKVSFSVTSATEENSGTYKCITPFGVQHSVEVVVKDVVCPAFILDEEYVFYPPTPEGKLRIMGTTAEINCEEGHKISAQCMANGNWSRGLPLSEECTMKKRKRNATWNCKPLDASQSPGLILEKDDDERGFTFKCDGGKTLVGKPKTSCLKDGSWNNPLPSCRN